MKKKCQQCGNQYDAKRNDSRFCSPKCRVKWNRQNKFCYDKYRQRHCKANRNNNEQDFNSYKNNSQYYVYLATRSDAPYLYKIGYTSNLKQRAISLKSFFKTQFKIISIIKCNCRSQARHIEKKIHQLLWFYHTEREFFYIKSDAPIIIFNKINDFLKPVDPWDNNFKPSNIMESLKSIIFRSEGIPF